MEIRMEKEWENARVTLREEQKAEGVTYLHVDVCCPEAETPRPVTLHFSVPCVDMVSQFFSQRWNIRSLRPHWDWSRAGARGRLASEMPLLSLISAEDRNRLTVSLSDADNDACITCGVREETAEVDFVVKFFLSPMPKTARYHAILRMDSRSMRYEDAIREAVRFWEEECGYTPAPVPEAARLPMYSTWYSYHQKMDTETLVAQCALAKPLGMDTVIIDDGWQTDDNNRGYAYCGDWEVTPGKIPSMRELVDRIHALGMKVMLWYSVPYVGIHSKSFERFRGMYLEDDREEGRDTFRLDPRYRETREYLVDTYRRALLAYGHDGFKLDFIDSFTLNTPYSLREDPGRDIPSLEDAVNRLLTDVMTALREINPDILIEFRQSYVGPAIRKYGNMLRAADCPNDPYHNRLSCTDLRLTSGKTAVHSDMIMWHKDEPVERAAFQVLATLFAVNQISVKLEEQSPEHLLMLRHLLTFMREHQGTLLDAPFYANSPANNYTVSYAQGEGEFIAVDYAGVPVSVGEGRAYVFSASGRGETVLRLPENAEGRAYRVLDCMGKTLEEGILDGAAFRAFSVPMGGMIEIL